jgi:ABC-type dipeptide/oligopeptide/nickel transport system permease subunit
MNLFASKDGGNVAIGKIAAAMTFIISSCFMGLAGMIFIGAPLEDHHVRTGRIDKPTALSRAAWSVFPLVALIFLVLTFFLVITPVRK